MTESERYSVIAIDGEYTDFGRRYTPSLRYDGLTWRESAELARLSLSQGFEVVIWRIDTGAETERGDEACGEV